MRASKLFTYDIDLDGNRLLNAVLNPVEQFPANPQEGQVVNKLGVLHMYVAGQWKPVGATVGSLKGGFDADAATELPSPSLKEDYWWVVKAGDVDGLFDPQLEVGTMIVALVDDADPLDVNDWLILRIGGGHASLSEYGLVRLASVQETREGIDQEKVITPFTLAGMKADETEANDPSQGDRFITPEGLFLVKASKTAPGIVRIATAQEVEDGEKEDVAVSPKDLKESIPEAAERTNIHDAVLSWLQFASPNGFVWKISIDNNGNQVIIQQ
jgi:hypothetical protein